jgi:hypothetical protein
MSISKSGSVCIGMFFISTLLCEIAYGYDGKYIIGSFQTSVFGSNIFFNNKHSLGIPTGSTTGVGITCVGRPGAGITPGLPIGKLKGC